MLRLLCELGIRNRKCIFDRTLQNTLIPKIITMKKSIFILGITLLSFSLYAQDLRKGYEFAEEGTIYLTDKDSVQGVLAFTYVKNNQVVLVGEKETKYKPEDIKGFYLKTSNLNFVSGQYGLGYKAFLQVVVPGMKAKVIKTFVITKGVKIEEGKDLGVRGQLHFIWQTKV